MNYTPYLNGNTRLHWLAMSPKNNRVLEYVLMRMPQAKRIAAVNARNTNGQTPLHAACSNRNFSAIAILSNAGALNVGDNSGKKPYDLISETAKISAIADREKLFLQNDSATR